MARALLVKPARLDPGRMTALLEDLGLEVQLLDSLDDGGQEPGPAGPEPDILVLDAIPPTPGPPAPSRLEWILTPPELSEEAESYCREWGGWLVDDPLRRKTLLRKVVWSILEGRSLRRSLGEEGWIHAVDDLWFPILERLKQREN